MSAWNSSAEAFDRLVSPERPGTGPVLPPLRRGFLESESSFYRRYDWARDAFPTLGEVGERLRGELSSLGDERSGWQREEMGTNLFLLSCALADVVDDYLAGDSYDFSRATALLPVLRPPARAAEGLMAVSRSFHAWRGRGVRAWRVAWGAALDVLLQAWLAGGPSERAAVAAAGAGLTALLGGQLPADLRARRVRVPAAFRTQDLAHHDILELSDRFADAYPDRERALLVVGLRTAGSYFAPLLRASLALKGYRDLDVVTLRPKKGAAPWERAALARAAARRSLVVVVDEPADTGSTVSRMVDVLRAAGIPPADVVALLPVHPTRPDWSSGYESLPLCMIRVLALEPADWHKQRLLDATRVEHRLRPYFEARGYAAVSIVDGPAAARFNRRLQSLSEEKFHTRLKHVYEARLQTHDGRMETRYVMAKSVGWGWLGYHAFQAGEALSDFLPPILGLRDGILYTEWLPQGDPVVLPRDRERLLRRAAAYVAARVRLLRLSADPGPELARQHQKGVELLAGALSGAYGWKPAAVLKRERLRRELSRRPCPVPTLIDGKMRLQEWIRSGASLLKTDFEAHAFGKTELNVTDPAYDLAEAILYFGLSADDEQTLLRLYREDSGDESVEERLFLQKLLAGTAAVNAALANLKDPRLGERHEEFNQAYIDARDFLTRHTVRFCAQWCRPAGRPRWRSPLAVLDIDGVLDKQIFGYPSTTAAGVAALALLHAHGVAVSVNSARTLAEVQEYCEAYGGVGGVAEYGSVAWDAVSGRTQVLVSPESFDELQRLAEALRGIPGLFLNERYEHSLRAYAYEGSRTVPVPAGLVEGTLARLGLTRLNVHRTYLDTTVLAREVDKGQGLLALLRLAGHEDLDTIAIGDSEPDLAMFRVAGRSFAPAHISGRNIARLLGCQIAGRSYQPGLLAAARAIVHADGKTCPRCRGCVPKAEGLVWELLKAADRRPLASLLRAVADPLSREAFLK
jgi:haloacid dehalogenase-like hydrolase